MRVTVLNLSIAWKALKLALRSRNYGVTNSYAYINLLISIDALQNSLRVLIKNLTETITNWYKIINRLNKRTYIFRPLL